MSLEGSKPTRKHKRYTQHANHSEAHTQLPGSRLVQRRVLTHFATQLERVRRVQEDQGRRPKPSLSGIGERK